MKVGSGRLRHPGPALGGLDEGVEEVPIRAEVSISPINAADFSWQDFRRAAWSRRQLSLEPTDMQVKRSLDHQVEGGARCPRHMNATGTPPPIVWNSR